LGKEKAEEMIRSEIEAFMNIGKKPNYVKKYSDIIITSILRGGTTFAVGNGGSATQASHFCGELVGRYKQKRRALPAIALTTDPAVITALSNDFGFQNVFVRQLEALSKDGDVLLALSTSGRSKNVLRAIKWAKKNGLEVIDVPRVGKDTPTIQENQLKMLHKIAEKVEKYFA